MNTTGAAIHAGPVAVRFLVEPEESGGSVSVFECGVPPDVQTPAPHSHDGFEETIYGLEGVSTWTVDGDGARGGPRRGGLHPPRRRCTASRTAAVTDAVFLAVATPGLFGPAYFLEIGEVVAAAAGRPARHRRDHAGDAPPRAHARTAGRPDGPQPPPMEPPPTGGSALQGNVIHRSVRRQT